MNFYFKPLLSALAWVYTRLEAACVLHRKNLMSDELVICMHTGNSTFSCRILGREASRAALYIAGVALLHCLFCDELLAESVYPESEPSEGVVAVFSSCL